MIFIHLNNLQFHAFHGIHEQERSVGSHFEVNVELYIEANDKIMYLEQTVNYAIIYEIIRVRMERPAKLLETLAQEMVQAIHLKDDRIRKITVQITKKNPSITGLEGNVGVTCINEF